MGRRPFHATLAWIRESRKRSSAAAQKNGRTAPATNSPLSAQRRTLFEVEKRVQGERIAFQPGQFADLGHPARLPLTIALDMNDQLDAARRYSGASVLRSEVNPAETQQQLEPAQRLTRHCLAWIVDIEPSWPVDIAWQHLNRFATAHLTQDDAIGGAF